MDALHIDFEATGGVIDFNKKSSGFRTTVQNAMVHMGQKSGSSVLFPALGSNLHSMGLQGDFGRVQSFTKALQLLRAGLLEFSHDYDEAPHSDKIKKLDLTLGQWQDGYAEVQVQAESHAGEQSENYFQI